MKYKTFEQAMIDAGWEIVIDVHGFIIEYKHPRSENGRRVNASDARRHYNLGGGTPVIHLPGVET